MHLHHVASGTPVVAILRPARTPKGTEVRTVIKHVTKRLKRHRPTPGLSGAATVTTAASRRWTGQRTKARADADLIKLHKAQLSSDRLSCDSATANQVLVLHTAAF